jgi:Cd(II)/Pb(II)-responsive transcriptional regulator
MRIGDIAKKCRVTVEAIRYYEAQRLLPAPARNENNYRYYSEQHYERLVFIINCRSLDLSIGKIKQLLAVRDEPTASCLEANQLLRDQLENVLNRIQSLKRLEVQLKVLQARCQGENISSNCGILEGLTHNHEP